MAITHRTATRALEVEKSLEQTPETFDFYWAIRLLECAYPDAPRLGESLRPAEDPIRLGQRPSMAFAPASIASFGQSGEARKKRMEVLFFGLFGPHGPMPLHLTEYAHDRLQNAEDPTFSRFADIFHHRMLSLFYRAWAAPQPTINFDRPGQDSFSNQVGACFGLGMPSLQDRDAMPDLAKQHYAGWLSSQTRCADGLESMVAGFFKLPVKIEQFVGHWMTIPVEDRCYLGKSAETGSLGINSIIGAQVWDRQSKFRFTMGPLDLINYNRLLPGGNSLKRLISITRNYINDELTWDLKLILKKDEVPPLQLGGKTQLGWTTWLSNQPSEKDRADLTLNPLSL